MALLEKIGVWQDIAGEAAPLRTMRIVDGTARLIRAPEVAFHASEIGLDAFGYNIPNAVLVAALEAARRRAPDRPARSLRRGGRAGRRRGRADAFHRRHAVGARLVGGRRRPPLEGARRRRHRHRRAGATIRRRWSAISATRVPHDDTSTEFHTEAGPFTLVPLPGTALEPGLGGPPGGDRTAARRSARTALAAEIEARAQSVLGAIAIDGRRQMFPLSGMSARRFAANRVALAGEAAHLFPPIGAQGLNLGYRDVDRARRRARRPARRSRRAGHALAAYDRARRGDVFARTAAVDALNRTLLSGFLPVQALRGAGLFLLDRVAPLRRFAMRQGVALSGTDRPAGYP